MQMKKYILIGAACLAGIATTLPAAAQSTLDKIKRSGTIVLGHRENSIPFSFIDKEQQPRGYSVDLCRIVADDIAKQLGVAKLDVRWRLVTAQNRFDALKSGEIDLECGNTTQTLSRRADFDFSLMTFVDGAGLLFRRGEAPASPEELRTKTHRVAVVAGTTTEKTLDALIAGAKLNFVLLKVSDHDTAMQTVIDKTATAYAADRTVLITTAMLRGKGQEFDVAEAQFTYEPYGLAMRRDADFRLAVDRSLANLYRGGGIGPIMKRWFEPLGNPGETLRVMFLLNGLPE